MRNIIYSVLALLIGSANITAQVTIGSDQPPRAGAGLDLRSSDRGLLLPNVALTNPATAFQLKGGEGATATGMVVYNTSNNLDGPGVYVWDGSRWILITCVPETPGTIDLSPTAVNLNGTFTASVPEVTGPAAPTAYAWALPTGLTGTSTTRTITITGATADTYNAGTIKVAATNACGTSAEQTGATAITVRDCSAAPATPTLTVTATTINRTGTTTLSCTDVGNGATTYAWTLPSGLTGSSTTNTITVTGSTAGTYAASTIKVTATNDCGNATATGSGGAITVRDCSAAPATPTLTVTARTINRTGITTLSCSDVGNGATTYEWTLPAGLTGSSTTRTITITGATAGTYNAKSISVKATNDCGYITATGSGGAITVRDCSAAPAKPTLNITATTINRTGTTTLECTDVSNGATAYEWTLPSGLTGSSTTNTITVTGSTVGTYAAGTITVTATNDCGNTPATGSGGAITVNLVCPSSVTDSQGHEYSIGNFGSVGCWMTQNLRSTSGLTANLNAGNATNQKYYWYPNSSQSTFNSNPTYGLLYTWTAASGRAEADTDSNGVGITPGQEDHKGICPDGWHLPSDYEWNQLEEEIAKSAVNVYSTTAATTWESGYSTTLGYRGTHGQKMKSTTPVNSQATNGTSQSMTENGFDALLVGFMLGGSPLHYGAYTYFWSSSSGVSSSAWRRYLYRSDTGVYCSYNSKYCMYSVRCKKNDN